MLGIVFAEGRVTSSTCVCRARVRKVLISCPRPGVRFKFIRWVEGRSQRSTISSVVHCSGRSLVAGELAATLSKTAELH